MFNNTDLITGSATISAAQDKNLDVIIDRYQTMVYNVVLGIVQHEQEAEEATQDVFVKVYRGLQNFKAEAELKTWIYRIALNTAIDARKQLVRQKAKGFFGFGHAEEAEEMFYHPGVALDRKEDSARLFKAIESLPQKQKVAFILHKVEGLTAAEIAGITQATPVAVESLLARAKENLKQILKRFIV